jgi:hypothetical protein
VLDLVKPQRPGRRPGGLARQARGDEAGGQDTRQHGGQIAPAGRWHKHPVTGLGARPSLRRLRWYIFPSPARVGQQRPKPASRSDDRLEFGVARGRGRACTDPAASEMGGED